MGSSNTARLIIEGAIRLIKGSKYRASNPELGNGLIALNDLIASWSADQIHVPVVVSNSFPLVAAKLSYTIGVGGNINTVRPTEIKPGVYIRDSGGLDHQVFLITRERYRRIQNKDVGSRPTTLYYEPSYPLGTLFFNFAPTTVETVYYDSLQPITEITDATATLLLPPEYRLALRFNLAKQLSPEYADINLPEFVIETAQNSKDAIIRVNTLSKEETRLDPALCSASRFSKADFESG
jgi:hypothetical protein